jgi:hypothetical protein
MLRLIFFMGLKDVESDGPTVEGGIAAVFWMGSDTMGVMGPNSSSRFEWLESSMSTIAGDDSVSSLLRLEVENPLGERMLDLRSASSAFNKALVAGLGWPESCNEGVQQMGSSSLSSEESSIDDDPGRTYQKPTGDLDKASVDVDS